MRLEIGGLKNNKTTDDTDFTDSFINPCHPCNPWFQFNLESLFSNLSYAIAAIIFCNDSFDGRNFSLGRRDSGTAPRFSCSARFSRPVCK